MKLAHLAENTRFRPLVAAFLLCFAALLCAHQFTGFVAEPDFSSAPMAEHSPHQGSMGAAGGNQTQVGGYLPASLEEMEASGEGPVDAESLTALLLVVFFGVVLGLLFGGRMGRRDEALLLSERRLTPIIHYLQPGPSSSRLSVFLL